MYAFGRKRFIVDCELVNYAVEWTIAFDLPDSTRARLRVVGVDSIRVTDNNRIPRLELSPEATVNGGVHLVRARTVALDNR